MTPHKGYSREEILHTLQEFYKSSGRPPKTNEAGLNSLVEAAKREFGSWEHALKIAGLQTYKAWRKKRTTGGRICNLLNHNPLTLIELRQELNENENSKSSSTSKLSQDLLTAISQNSEIKSIGPRRSKIYYLKGQEKIAETRLNSVSSNLNIKQDMIYRSLKKPMTKNEIWNLFPQNVSVSSCDGLLKELAMAGLVRKVTFFAGNRGGKKYLASDLFGNLACKTYFFRCDCPEEMVKMIARNVPCSKLRNHGFRSSLTHRLKNILPTEVFSACMEEISALAHENYREGRYSRISDFLQ